MSKPLKRSGNLDFSQIPTTRTLFWGWGGGRWPLLNKQGARNGNASKSPFPGFNSLHSLSQNIKKNRETPGKYLV